MIPCAKLDQLQAAHCTWSGKGRAEGADPAPPWAGLLAASWAAVTGSGSSVCSSPCEERMLQAQGSLVLHTAPVPAMGSAPRQHRQSCFGGEDDAHHSLGTLLYCHKTLSGVTITGTLRSRCLGSPAGCEPCCHASGGSLPKAVFGTSFTGTSATTSRSADEKCHRAKANQESAGNLVACFCLICNIHTRPDRKSPRGQEYFQELLMGCLCRDTRNDRLVCTGSERAPFRPHQPPELVDLN